MNDDYEYSFIGQFLLLDEKDNVIAWFNNRNKEDYQLMIEYCDKETLVGKKWWLYHTYIVDANWR